MKIAVQGLWHLGVVTSAGLTSLDFNVVALDYDQKIVADLERGKLPVNEPGVYELLEKALGSGKIKITSDANALEECDIFWLAYDTPVDEQDIADVKFVFSEFEKSIAFLKSDAYVLISAQLPVGSARHLKEMSKSLRPSNNFRFAVQPENLRLGKSLKSLLEPERIIVGTESSGPEAVLEKLFSKFNTPIIWMSLESAEMTKHAINAFLATSITFMGEISDICELVSANARDVELGLRSDSRIGNKAYISPGLGFAGGTLARDIKFLEPWQKDSKGILSAVIESNRFHNEWIQRSFDSFFNERSDLKVLFMGLTYAEDTNTLRRSTMLDFASKLLDRDHNVSFYEDQEIVLPQDLVNRLKSTDAIAEHALGMDAIILSKKMPWVDDDNFVRKIVRSKAVIFDPSGLLVKHFQEPPSSYRYFTVGQVNAR
jgi:UDPglucose 6-dehydrogenase